MGNCEEVLISYHLVTNTPAKFFDLLSVISKASLDRLPKSIIVNTGTPTWYIAIVVPLLAECRPIWSAVNPRISGSKDMAARRSHFQSSVPVK
jgi:hypothetical protein